MGVMEHMFTRIYALLVCFVSMVCIAITTGVALYDVVKIINPELTLSPYQYQHLQSNETFRRLRYAPRPFITNEGLVEQRAAAAASRTQEKLSEDEITRLREKELETLIGNERRAATASLVRMLIILLVSCPLFYIHWRLAQRYEAAPPAT